MARWKNRGYTPTSAVSEQSSIHGRRPLVVAYSVLPTKANWNKMNERQIVAPRAWLGDWPTITESCCPTEWQIHMVTHHLSHTLLFFHTFIIPSSHIIVLLLYELVSHQSWTHIADQWKIQKRITSFSWQYSRCDDKWCTNFEELHKMLPQPVNGYFNNPP